MKKSQAKVEKMNIRLTNEEITSFEQLVRQTSLKKRGGFV